jgi:thioredoxin-dependent peroxiredoxin
MNRRRTALTAVALLLAAARVVLADPPNVGTAAPDFRLQDHAGRWRELREYRGKWVTLYFYTKDQAPSDTEQASQFRDNIAAFHELNAEVLGISVDDIESHKRFADRNRLPFPILADPTKATVTRYGVLKSFPGAGELAKRDTFLIDPEGRIAKHYPNVNPRDPPSAVLEDLKQLSTKSD